MLTCALQSDDIIAVNRPSASDNTSSSSSSGGGGGGGGGGESLSPVQQAFVDMIREEYGGLSDISTEQVNDMCAKRLAPRQVVLNIYIYSGVYYLYVWKKKK